MVDGKSDKVEGKIQNAIGNLKDALRKYPCFAPGTCSGHCPTLEGTRMKRSIALLAGAAVVAATFGAPAFSQGTLQTASIMKIDPASLASGYRTSKVVGSAVFNETNESVGTIDDLIVTPGDKVPFAVLSVGGFLGMGTKYVVVPYSSLQVRDNKMVLVGATKESLKALPEFKYSN